MTRNTTEIGENSTTVQEFCVSYNAVDFDESSLFYTDVLDFTPSVSWDRAAGRGAFFICGENGIVESFGAARGEAPFRAPPPDSFMIVIIVDDVESEHETFVANYAEICGAMEEFVRGKYFGVVDPN